MHEARCQGYFLGWLDVASIPFHIRENVSLGQMEREFVQYMAAHPERRNDRTMVVLRDALHEAGLLTLKTAVCP